MRDFLRELWDFCGVLVVVVICLILADLGAALINFLRTGDLIP